MKIFRNVLEGIGFLLMIVGIGDMDSDLMIAPVVMTTVGLATLAIGARDAAKEGEANDNGT